MLQSRQLFIRIWSNYCEDTSILPQDNDADEDDEDDSDDASVRAASYLINV